jgi:hypothetical protein
MSTAVLILSVAIDMFAFAISFLGKNAKNRGMYLSDQGMVFSFG